jgi:iron complex outermembrane receptor protein
MKHAIRLLLAATLLSIVSPANGLAQTKALDLREMSLEDLMNIQVTSAARKEQRAVDVAAAIFVITQDDIRRSGMTSIPDLLRLVPGVDVAQINSSQWAVSVRGFNALRANKLLVLVDGRSLYNRIFSGVVWVAEDLMLDDIDRIEVIRGPGAAIWGANAANGVINIVTKGAAETQGGLVRVDGGRSGEQGAVCYGGTLGAASYRLYTQWTRREESLIAPGTRANDRSQGVTAGFRADRTAKRDGFTVEGAFFADQTRALWLNLNPLTAASEPIATDLSDGLSGYVLGRWTHTRPSGASLEIQQDEIAFFGRRLAVSLGSQAQYDSDSGAGVQPTARVMWTGLPRQRLWAATSRALRTPSLSDRAIRVDFPPAPTASGLPLVITALGNRAAETETFVDAEAGYRLEIGPAGAIDVTGFVGHYDHLQTQEASAPITRATLNVALFHVGPLEQFQVAAYTRSDITAEGRFTSRLSAMAIGQNLFDAARTEFGSADSLLLATQVPRSANIRLVWRF